MNDKLRELKNRLLEINDLEKATALMYWDQSTYMPPGSAATRGRQYANCFPGYDHIADPLIDTADEGRISTRDFFPTAR